MSEHIYHYFISYFCRNEIGEIAPGFIEAAINMPITSMNDIITMKKKIEEENSESRDVIIMNYQLLRVE